ncbi:Ankyrin repeat containing protein [Gracilaria domingensis]|nr:Ankyrin repeat containing protein [Gracilaria domingensis]
MDLARSGDLSTLIQRIPTCENVNAGDDDGNTLLMCAAEHGYPPVIHELLRAHAQVNHENKRDDTALMLAATNGHSAVVELLLRAKANVNHTGPSGTTSLIRAATNKHYAVVEQLLRADAHVNDENDDESTALTIASQHGHKPMVKDLLRARAQVNHVDKNGSTSLIYAAQGGHFAIVEQLLEHEPLVDLCNNEGDTALLVAVRGKHENVAGRLCAAGADLTMTNNKGDTALSLLPEQSELAKQLREDAVDVKDSASVVDGIRATDGVEELTHMLQKGVKREIKRELVQQAVVDYMDKRSGRLGYEPFFLRFSELTRMYAESGHGKVRVELGGRFCAASDPDSQLALFREAGFGSGSSHKLSFRRTRDDWNECEVDELWKRRRVNGDMIERDGFVQVGMEVLFASDGEVIGTGQG